jgi:hypothetical protein
MTVRSILQRLTSLLSRSPIDVRSYAELKHIHRRRFHGTDPERFARLWCAVAHRCRVSPLEMNETSRVDELCPPRRFLGLVVPDQALEEVTALVIAESRGRPPPRSRPSTVADVLDYLLGTSSGAGVEKPNATKESL